MYLINVQISNYFALITRELKTCLTACLHDIIQNMERTSPKRNNCKYISILYSTHTSFPQRIQYLVKGMEPLLWY